MEYIPNTEEEQQQMLKVIGADSIESLLADIPSGLRLKGGLQLPPSMSEPELKTTLLRMSEKNADLLHHVSFLGAGAYDHTIPSAVNHLAFRSEFYTAYTPYQAEMSQGFLQTIYEFQTMICEMTGMAVANASLYDGGNALAEAAMMTLRITRRNTILLSSTIHPAYRAVLKTTLSGTGPKIIEIPSKDGVTDLSAAEKLLTDEVACVLLQTPNFFGCLEQVESLV